MISEGPETHESPEEALFVHPKAQKHAAHYLSVDKPVIPCEQNGKSAFFFFLLNQSISEHGEHCDRGDAAHL